MSQPAYPRPGRRPRRARRLPALACLAAVSAAAWAVVVRPHGEGAVVRAPTPSVAEAATVPSRTARPDTAWMLDPAPALGAATAAFGRAAPLAPRFPQAAVQVAAAPEPPAPDSPASDAPAARAPVRTLAALPATLPAAPARIAAAEPPADAPPARSPFAPSSLVPSPLAASPLPVPRPAELGRTLAAPAQRVAGRPALPRTRDVFRAALAPEPSFFDRLFGLRPEPRQETPRQVLAYADPDAGLPAAPRPRLSPSPDAVPSAGTAVYDISAGRVSLPSGEVLEAHSGYGAMMDDPRYVHVRMRGATPPGTYEMTERERPFHGVRAIRLNPVGGSAAIHGRDGILAHTYMLRQPGASNGCVVFRDYDRFLQAFLRGEVRRLVVVAGAGRGDFPIDRVGTADRRGRRG